MVVTQSMIWEELQEQKKLIKQLLEKGFENSIEEISLYKASKKLHMSQETIIDLVKSGKLEARTYKDNARKTRFRFKVADIHKFQQAWKYDHASLHAADYESAESIAKRIFNQEGV